MDEQTDRGRRGPASVAKVTPPRVRGCFPRGNLFRLLDASRKRPVVWISAQAGSGKTTLVCSYIEARGIPCLWYKMDEGDADPATFFYYLGLAARRAAPRRRKALPLLTPEYLPGLSVFSRRYFERLCALLKAGTVLVFDDCQKVPPDSAVYEAMRDGLSALPKGLGAVFISRGDPPPAFARARAHRTMELIGWKDLRLTPAETEGIVRLRWKGKPPKGAVRALHGRTDGWAAALVLLMEQPGGGGAVPRIPADRSPGELFDYFAEEVFGGLGEDVRGFLLRSAILPWMTVGMAERLAGEPRAGQILSYLARNNCFTRIHPNGEPVYEYHSLFREFLLARGRAALPADEIDRIRRAAADLLLENGQPEAAAGLLRECGAWEGLVRIVLMHAPSLVAQGRYRTLEEWLGALPKAAADGNPWLRYWKGACRLPFDARESRAAFEEAFRRFHEQRITDGVFLAWSGIAESIMYGHEGLKPLDRWISLLDGLMSEFGDFPSEAIGGRVTCSMIRALALRRPPHFAMERWADRAHACAQGGGEFSGRIDALVNLAIYRYGEGDLRKLEFLLGQLRETVRRKDVSPLARLTVHWLEAAHANLTSRYDRVAGAVSEGLALAESTGVHVMDYVLMGQGALGSLKTGNFAAAGACLRRMASSLPAAKTWESGFYHYVAAWEAQLRGDPAQAFLHSDECLALCEEVGNPWTRCLSLVQRGFLSHAAGDGARAAELLSRALQTGARSRNEYTHFVCRMTQACFHLREGNESAALPALREGMRAGRERGYVNLYMWPPGALEQVVAKALEAGIETAYARELIRKNALLPPGAPDAERWPYPLQVFTLGRFSLLKEGEPLPFSRKVQQKPLQLLKILIALGGSGVTEESISDLLWPDSEGDLAHRAFTTTLYRLRRLIGDEKAIVLRDGKLVLSARHAWVDAWAFERLIDRAWSVRNRKDREEESGESILLLEKAVALYKGPFLPEEEKHPWAASLRDHLRSRFRWAVEALGRRREESDDWERAAECYRKGLDADNLAEEFYRRLMICYRRLGRDAEAKAVYDACRNVLNGARGAGPSPGMEAIYRILFARV